MLPTFTEAMKRPLQVFNYKITNAANDAVDIYIDGDIVDAATQQFYAEYWGDDTSVSYKSFRESLLKSDVSTYNIYINSAGGLVTDAMAMHDLIKDMRAKGKVVKTYGRGIVASAATYILMAGESEMSENSWFMIHNASTVVWGDVNEVERIAAWLRKFNNSIRDFYSNATGIRKEEITKMMDAETWMQGPEAKEKGFVSGVSGAVSFTNKINPEHWNYSNTNALAAYNSAVRPPVEQVPDNSFLTNQFNEMKKFFEDLKNTLLNAVKNVKAPENNDHAALMNSIGEAVSAPFENIGEQIENHVGQAVKNAIDEQKISDQISEAVKNIDLTEAIKNAVDEAVKPLMNQISELEKKNEELSKDMENEILNKKGNASNSGSDGGAAPIGSFSKK